MLPVAILRSDNPTDLTHASGTALLDTGATSSAIGPQIIEKMQLRPYSKRPVVVATEQRLVDYYFFRVGLFTDDAAAPIPYVFAETSGFGMQASDSFDIILGMDVLSQCDFTMDRDGEWKLTFG